MADQGQGQQAVAVVVSGGKARPSWFKQKPQAAPQVVTLPTFVTQSPNRKVLLHFRGEVIF
jgi:hypothetical protein